MASSPVPGAAELSKTRKEIIDVVSDCINSIKNFSGDPSLGESDADWLVKVGQQAKKKIQDFWKSIPVISPSNPVQYLGLVQLTLRKDENGLIQCERTEIESLETFFQNWFTVDIEEKPSFLICFDRDKIGYKGQLPYIRPAEVCNSASIVLLFLLQKKYSIGYMELKSLLNTITRHIYSEFIPPLRALRKAETTFAKISSGLQSRPLLKYHERIHYRTSASSTEGQSAMKLQFPGAFPTTQDALQHMDIWKPHGDLPNLNATSTIWGASESGIQQWSCVTAFAHQDYAVAFDSSVKLVFDSQDEIKNVLFSHWAHFVHLIHLNGLLAAKGFIRDALEEVEILRFRNTSDPTTRFAHRCAMYANHLRYYERVIVFLDRNLGCFPPAWGLNSPVSPSPDWVEENRELCKSLISEVSFAKQEISYARDLTIQQLSLYQAQKTKVLTVMASAFIPITFVASFFGMNTVEINNSQWPLRYYFIAAGPLTLVSILAPLYLIPLYAVVARNAPKYLYRGRTALVTHIIFFLLNIVTDLTRRYKSLIKQTVVLNGIIGFYMYMLVFLVSSQYARKIRYLRHQQSVKLVDRLPSWKSTILLLLGVSIFISRSLLAFLEIPVYVAFFLYSYFEYRQRRKIERREEA